MDVDVRDAGAINKYAANSWATAGREASAQLQQGRKKKRDKQRVLKEISWWINIWQHSDHISDLKQSSPINRCFVSGATCDWDLHVVSSVFGAVANDWMWKCISAGCSCRLPDVEIPVPCRGPFHTTHATVMGCPSFTDFIFDLSARCAEAALKRFCPYRRWTAQPQLTSSDKFLKRDPWKMKISDPVMWCQLFFFSPGCLEQNVPFIDLRACGSRIQTEFFIHASEVCCLREQKGTTQD